MAAGGGRVINSKIKDRMKKRELQSKNAGGGGTRNLKSGNNARGGSKNRSLSQGSLEEHVDPAQMMEYFMEQSKAISKKAEGDRGQLNKVLDINRKMREYDLKRIKGQEIEDMTVNIKRLNDDWTELRAFLQHKV